MLIVIEVKVYTFRVAAVGLFVEFQVEYFHTVN